MCEAEQDELDQIAEEVIDQINSINSTLLDETGKSTDDNDFILYIAIGGVALACLSGVGGLAYYLMKKELAKLTF